MKKYCLCVLKGVLILALLTWIRKKTDFLILQLCIKMHWWLIFFLASKDQQLFFAWLSGPGFCGFISQSPVCLAFCADSLCEEYFSTSLAAPLACFPSSFFGCRVCFFFVSVNIISSLPCSVETVVWWVDLNFSGTQQGSVCVCIVKNSTVAQCYLMICVPP